MTDYIGAKLSLVSKSDIRYVGILHEIDSVNSTVSLEQVRSFGTEGESGRKGDPALEIPASDNVFEYIIFRGSDVKDLRVEQGATSQPPAPRQAPQDPAILQTGPPPQQQPHQQHQQQSYHQQPMPHRAPREFDGQQYGAPPPQGYGYGYPPPQHQQHFGGPPPQGYGYPPQNAPQPGFQQPQQEQGLFAPQPQNAFPDLPSDSQALPSAQQASQKKAPVKTEGEKPTQAKIVPALPLPGHAASPRPRTGKGVNDITKGINDLSTTPAAASASAASNGQAPKRNALLEVQRNMKSSTTTANNTVGGSPAPVPSVPEPVANAPATRSEPRSNNARRDPGIRQNGVIVNPNASIVIPKDEYDFSSANAKFSRDGLDSEVQAAPVYDKKSSFFDSISSEASDRGEGGGGRGRGREIRNQERTMNYETFGEDLAFRNNRGRGRGGRGRGRGRGRGASQPVQ